MTWIQTFSGIAFDYNSITLDSIQLIDIAHALSNFCRFNGHCRSHYSVAQHSVICSYQSHERLIQQCCLMHDAAEAYLGDMVRPLKNLPDLKPYWDRERDLERLIARKFGLPFPMPEIVREIDMRVLATEAQQLFGKPPMPWSVPDAYPNLVIKPQPPGLAEASFLERFHELLNQEAA